MTNPSEAEVAAAINAIQRVLFEVGIQADVIARAALVAAAQVRENVALQPPFKPFTAGVLTSPDGTVFTYREPYSDKGD
jgi:hypothetical protein